MGHLVVIEGYPGALGGHFGGHLGLLLCHFGDHQGVTCGSLWGCSGSLFFGHVGDLLGHFFVSLWGHGGIIFGSFLNPSNVNVKRLVLARSPGGSLNTPVLSHSFTVYLQSVFAFGRA